jgi:cytochrome c556
MRKLAAFFAAAAALAQAPVTPQPVGSMNELMRDIIYPASDAIFYIQRNPPKTDQEWNTLRGTALTLAESGNLLMMPSRARDQGDWMRDAKMLVDTATDAWKAAQAKNVEAVEALNDRLYVACVTCHEQYRPGYRKRL